MPINFSCPECGKSYSVPSSGAGKKAKCKACGAQITVPLPKPKRPDNSPNDSQPDVIEAEVVTLAEAVAEDDSNPEMASLTRKVKRSSAETSSAEALGPIGAGASAFDDALSAAIPAASFASEGFAAPVAPITASPQVEEPAISQDELLAAIASKIERVPTTLTYRLACLAVAAVMVLLPLIYVGIIALTIFGVGVYAIAGTGLFEVTTRSGRGGIFLVLLYVGPIAIGITTVIFMIKPLFARRASDEKRRSLTRDGEPKLFAFVDKLCEAVHAPKPKRIDVDCDVNASASFRRGMWSILFGNDLVLTIGMPLAAGMTARQLAGVLAHEFGHFSQGFGMRVSYVTRSINFWFQRVVYERDAWDEWLANTANSLDIRIGIVLQLARVLIWCTRRILWVLMMIGHIVSCNLMRQMEYDADLHEVRFSGSENFRKSTMALRVLGLAFHQSIVDQRNFFMDGKLADDMPKLTKINRETQDEQTVRKLFKGVMDEQTSWFATHPVDKDRVARAKEENETGVFTLDIPASQLFEHFEAICKGVTLDKFKAEFGDELKMNMLMPVEHLVAHKAAAQEATDALRRMFGANFNVPRQMSFEGNPAPASSKAEIANLQQARQNMVNDLASYSSLSKEFDEADSMWLLCHQCIGLLDLGITLDQKDFKVPVTSSNSTHQAATQFRTQLANMSSQLKPFETAFESRVAASISLLMAPSMQAKVGEQASNLLLQAQTVCRTLPLIQAAYADVVKFRNEYSTASLMLHVIGGQEVSAEIVSQVMSKMESLSLSLRKFGDKFAKVAFPFQHSDGVISMSQYMVPKQPTSEEIGELLHAAEKALEGYHYVYFRSLGTLAMVCQAVESSLGLPPQDLPPLEDDESAEAAK